MALRTSKPVEDRWYVTNGVNVVGPVGLDLLVRGVVHGRVPHDTYVRNEQWRVWRALGRLRELSSVVEDGPSFEAPRRMSDATELVARASDLGEALLCTLAASMWATGAHVGILSRSRVRSPGLITAYVKGPGATELLGLEVSSSDPVYLAARAGESVLGEPARGPVQLAIERRLRPAAGMLRGVAMVPVRKGSTLVGMMELGRLDHPVRARDMAEIESIVAALTARIDGEA